jgi:hypothetical protein
MNDKEIRDLLHDYVRGHVGEEQKKEIESALAASDSLKQEIARVRAYYGALDDMGQVRASDDFLDKVHERIQRRQQTHGVLWKLFFPLHIKVPLELVGVAATVLLIVFLYNPYRSQLPAPAGTYTARTEEVASEPSSVQNDKQESRRAFAGGMEKKARSSSQKPVSPSKEKAAAKVKQAGRPRAQPTLQAAAAPATVAPTVEKAPTGQAMAQGPPNTGLTQSSPPASMAMYETKPALADEDRLMELEKTETRRMSKSAQKIPETSAKKAKQDQALRPEIPAQWTPSANPDAFSAGAGTQQPPEEFLTMIIEKYNASVIATDSANSRNYTILISSGFLTPFLDQLRSRGELRISGTMPSVFSSEKVTIRLKSLKKN